MNYSATNETSIDLPNTSSTIYIIFPILLYAIGLFINIKNIIVCKTEKSRTWQIDISHAVVMSIVFAVRIPIMAATYLLPKSFLHSGRWICHMLAFVFSFGAGSINSHSLIVAIMKYVSIVHAMKVRSFGEDKIKKIFFLVTIAVQTTFQFIAG